MTIKQKNYTDLLIIEKYEKFLDYMYPISQNIPRKHGIIKEKFITCMFNQVELFAVAGKSNQISKLYSCDSNIHQLRFWLRFLEGKNVKAITPKQHQVSSIHLAEVGSILGTWIYKLNRKIKKYLLNKDIKKLNLFLSAWMGHIQWANCNHLISHLENYYETYY